MVQFAKSFSDDIHMTVGIDAAGNCDTNQVNFRVVDHAFFIFIRESGGIAQTLVMQHIKMMLGASFE